MNKENDAYIKKARSVERRIQNAFMDLIEELQGKPKDVYTSLTLNQLELAVQECTDELENLVSDLRSEIDGKERPHVRNTITAKRVLTELTNLRIARDLWNYAPRDIDQFPESVHDAFHEYANAHGALHASLINLMEALEEHEGALAAPRFPRAQSHPSEWKSWMSPEDELRAALKGEPSMEQIIAQAKERRLIL